MGCWRLPAAFERSCDARCFPPPRCWTNRHDMALGLGPDRRLAEASACSHATRWRWLAWPAPCTTAEATDQWSRAEASGRRRELSREKASYVAPIAGATGPPTADPMPHRRDQHLQPARQD